jgi:hypothetical protein
MFPLDRTTRGRNAQISMPPARLPARIDRSGLGGGSFLSPVGEESPLATGAVAAATEGMADSVLARQAPQAISCRLGPSDPFPPVAVKRCAGGRDSGSFGYRVVGFSLPEVHTAAQTRCELKGGRARRTELRRSIRLIYRHRGRVGGRNWRRARVAFVAGS